MTIQELYDWAITNNCEDFSLGYEIFDVDTDDYVDSGVFSFEESEFRKTVCKENNVVFLTAEMEF